MRTPATELVGIDVPIFAFSHSPEQLDIDLAWIEEQVGGKAYGVDLLVPAKFVGSDEGGFDRAQLRDLLPDERLHGFLDS